ncbi:MAG: MBL fold metallo-hydrolase, partial [Gammaproteobacteria bacterium]|nr:N-acyl homoserine lactonase family protein [Gammaproteobacteria bacterium]NIR24689.1 N-acyl homoserine lactonase family protein [Gammaproteobacteria bacterium]NIS06303.1 N-acyl homoserine lactonase family protein [Gammaproteobacteria bacterium]NIU42129.1 MBL fold metallo-hydrolase [Gammaproteobacteria bacterium]NIV49059.1 MBL fold metallo-hydrolase [Gammaproteobacteria bacterium]
MAANELYEIYALRYAERVNRTRGENFKVTDDHDAPMPIDYFIWVVRNDARTIVVDTGFGLEEARKRERNLLQTPEQALASIGVELSTVEDVVITHLHYDHAGTMPDFSRARFHLQCSEMAFATGPAMLDEHERWAFSADHVCDMVRLLYDGRVVFHDEDADIAPGITLHRLPGHTDGLQAVRVPTRRGAVLLASDASHFYENFMRRSPFPICYSEADTLRSYDRLEELADSEDHIIPGHDPLVRALYAAPSSELQ